MLGPEFSWPLRPWSRVKCDAAFLSLDYFTTFGKYHRGCDLNLVTGGDSDLGYPVCNILPGTVSYAGNPGSWGGVVVVRADEWVRRLFERVLDYPLPVLEFQYAHLLHVCVQNGDVLNAGDVLGSVGKGTDAQYLAHLHLELRRAVLSPYEPQGGLASDQEAAQTLCLDPYLVLGSRFLGDHPNTLAQRPYYLPTRVLGVEYAGEAQAVLHPIGDKAYLEGF